MTTLDSLEKVFETDLRDVYDAEKRLTKALPKMAKAAESEELKKALKDHVTVTTGQVGRIERIFQAAGLRVAGKPCAGMKGLIEEGQEAMESDGEAPFTDIALICAARRVEHYEMAAYMSLLDLAEELHGGNVVDMLRESLREEEEADQTLASIAQNLVAESRPGESDEEEDEEQEEADDEEAGEEEMEGAEEEEEAPVSSDRR